ncbi:hypothetical protein ACHAQH_008448 [Verticillium albo-atrum]
MATYNKLSGTHVLVIGGTKGIGRGVAEAAIEAGARVTVVASTQNSVDAAVSAIRSKYLSSLISGISCDLSKASVEADLDALFEQIGEINHVVVTASNSLPSILPVQEMTADDMRTGHARVVVSMLIAKCAARHLPRHRASSLTFTSGSVADQPQPGYSLLGFLARGTEGLVRGLALDLQPVRVNVVEPGYILDTGLWSGVPPEQVSAMRKNLEEKMPTGSAGQVEDVAEAYIYCMKDRNCTGETIKSRAGQHLV